MFKLFTVCLTVYSTHFALRYYFFNNTNFKHKNLICFFCLDAQLDCCVYFTSIRLRFNSIPLQQQSIPLQQQSIPLQQQSCKVGQQFKKPLSPSRVILILSFLFRQIIQYTTKTHSSKCHCILPETHLSDVLITLPTGVQHLNVYGEYGVGPARGSNKD